MAEHLLPGEELILKRHRHWIVAVKSMTLPVLVVVAAALAAFLSFFPSDYRLIAVLAALAVAGLSAIVVYIRWSAASFTLTNQRVLLAYGVFSRNSKVIPIDRVQDVSTQQSLLGRVFGYGRVEIDAAGSAGAEVLDHMPEPDGFRDQVFVQSGRLRGAPVAAGT
jgi:uncharacterized membrane protein YdbT with pleckstrin-like domain